MPSPYLTKTEFKAAYDCATKLFYRRQKYPTTLDDNEYMKFLANSGFMVETVAKAQYPHGVDLVDERDPQRAFTRTQELLLASDNAVVFEAAALFGKFYARIDILRREGKTLHLIEVKSSSINEEDEEDDGGSPFLKKDGDVAAKWMPYLLDVTFQLHVLRLAFPEFEVKPWLCVINKGCKATANETLAHFSADPDKDTPTKARPKVNYSGDLEQLKGTSLLTERDVTNETGLLMDRVVKRADERAALISPDGQVVRVQGSVADLYNTCRKCEFRFGPGKERTPHGFAECWGSMASVQPHILDMHRVGQIGTTKFPDPVPELIRKGKASLLDLKEDQLGNEGAYTKRRRMQWSNSFEKGNEHLPAALKNELKSHEAGPGRPFHFLDFEACDVVLPHHAGLRPYERVAFQWSCHTLNQQGKLSHQEWLNTERDFPNFTFARRLRDCIGDTGTVYVWSHYEQTTLCKVLKQINEWIAADEAEALRVSGFTTIEELKALAVWLEDLLGPEDADKKRKNSPRIRDLHKLALAHYFHPEMLGRTSIKAVLPAVWRHSSALWENPWFAKYYRADASGQALDPYKTLEPLPLGEEDEEGDGDAVREGTGAIRIYQELIFLQGLTEEFKINRKQLLLQYCELDTAAMVMIWAHWTGYVGAQRSKASIKREMQRMSPENQALREQLELHIQQQQLPEKIAYAMKQDLKKKTDMLYYKEPVPRMTGLPDLKTVLIQYVQFLIGVNDLTFSATLLRMLNRQQTQTLRRVAPRTGTNKDVWDHVIPTGYIVSEIMRMLEARSIDGLERLLDLYAQAGQRAITKEEDAKLNASGLRNSMPHGWDWRNEDADLFARYKSAGIDLS